MINLSPTIPYMPLRYGNQLAIVGLCATGQPAMFYVSTPEEMEAMKDMFIKQHAPRDVTVQVVV